MRILRWILAVFIGGVIITGCAHAADLSMDQFSDPYTFLKRVETFLDSTLRNDLKKSLGGSDDIRKVSGYTSWAYALMFGAWAMKLAEVSGRTAVFGESYAEIIGVIITGIVAQILFSSYGKWTLDLLDAGESIGELVQAKVLNNSDVMFPYEYIIKLGSRFQVSRTPIEKEAVGDFLNTAFFVFSLCTLYAAGLFACMWPMLVGGIAILIGPLTLMFVFHKSVSWIFDGWLRLIFWATIFAFASRVAMIMICLFFGNILSLGTSILPYGEPVTVDNTYPFAFICLTSMVVVALILLFFSGVLASIITGGIRIDASDMIKGLSQKAGRALLSFF